jgi:hypothetical protein
VGPLLLLLSLACGPVGTRHVQVAPRADASEDTGGSGPDTGGSGGSRTPDASATGGRGTGGSTGGSGGGGGASSDTGGQGGRDASPGTGGTMGPPDASPDLAPDLPPDAAETCVTGMAGAYMNTPMANQTGKFTVRFSASASMSPSNGIVGLSMGPQNSFAGYAVAVRFNTTGTIDGINGGSYAAVSTVNYTAGGSYQFRMTVDVAAHSYSLFVTPPGGTEATVANNYGFRTGTTTVAGLNSWAVVMQSMATGTLKACGFALQ